MTGTHVCPANSSDVPPHRSRLVVSFPAQKTLSFPWATVLFGFSWLFGGTSKKSLP